MSMTDDEFDEFLARSAGSLQTKQDTLTKEYGFGTFDQWVAVSSVSTPRPRSIIGSRR